MGTIKIIKGHLKRSDYFDKFVTMQDIHQSSIIFAQAYINWHKAFRKTLSPFDLTVAQWMVLHSYIFSRSPMFPSQIVKRLSIEGTSISTMLTGMENRRLIKRRRSKTNMRTVEIYLTEQGYELLNKVEPRIIELTNHVFGALSESKRKTTIRLSREIRNKCISWMGKEPGAAELIFHEITQLMPVQDIENHVRSRRKPRTSPR